MNKTAFIFPGQGAQVTGMAEDFYNNFDSSKNVFEIASKELGSDIAKLVFEEENTVRLGITENTQPAVLCASYAMLIPLLESGIYPDFVAGLSLGEFTAHVCAGSLMFKDAIKIVKKRGKFMQEAVPLGEGAMAAIIALDSEQVIKACIEAGDAGIVEAVNYNCPGQIVISGAVDAVNKACELCKAKGAKRAIVLPVSAPFHSSMLIDAGIKLEKELDKYEIYDMKYNVIANVDAKVISDKNRIKELLVKQVTSPVLWWDSIITLVNEGVDTFVEIGPGKTLTGFLKKIDPDLKGYNISSVEEFETVKGELNGIEK